MKSSKLERSEMNGVAASLVPLPGPDPHSDLSEASPETIKAEIARTRAHMDDRLSQLGRKFRPRVNMGMIQIPLIVLASLLAGFAAYRMASPKRKAGPKASINRFKVRTAGMRDHFRTLQLAVSVIRKGKPAILIVEPPK